MITAAGGVPALHHEIPLALATEVLHIGCSMGSIGGSGAQVLRLQGIACRMRIAVIGSNWDEGAQSEN